MLAHQSQHAGPGSADVTQDAQPRPDLAMPFTGERRGRQIGADRLKKVGIRHLRLRPALQGNDGTTLAATLARVA
jgi:hypothetical protein